jgi:ADP-heptose:LPS heptosyltransferase
MSASAPPPAPRLLLIRRRYLGDLVLLGAAIRNLRLHWPTAHLAVLTEPAYAGVVPLNPDLNAALAFPAGPAGWPAFLRTLRRERFTHVLDFDNTEKTALVTRLSGAPLRATFHRERIAFRYRRLYTHTATVTNAFYDSHHITDTYLALPAALGVPVASREVRLVPRDTELAAAQKLLGGPRLPRADRPARILLHPGSRSLHRVWPADRFAAVCDRLQDESGAQIFLLAGPGERDLLDDIRRQAKTHLVALKPLGSVPALAALAAQCDVFLCHDSGPMHIAAAVGTPVVALFGSQNATIWRPLGDRHTVLQPPLPCPCLGPAAPTPCVRSDSYRSWCVRLLTAEQVFAAVARALRQ